MRSRLLTLMGLLALSVSMKAAAELQLFKQDSLDQITQARTGQAFLLVLWSLDCPPCMKELKLLGKLEGEFVAHQLVLVSTDGPDNHAEVTKVLMEFKLKTLKNWAFADNFVERLRFAIDPNWFGEIPRAYFYDVTHTRKAVSGALSDEMIRVWLSTAISPDK